MKLASVQNYSNQHNRNSNLHFDGQGRLVVRYRNIAEKKGQYFLFQEIRKSEVLQHLLGQFKKEKMELDEALKKALLEHKIINEKGDILVLRPKWIKIEAGEGHFDENSIRAHRIVMNGGEVEHLDGINVQLHGGKVTRGITADHMTAHNDFVIPGGKVEHTLKLRGNSSIGGRMNAGMLEIFDDAKVAKGAEVEVDGYCIFGGIARLNGNAAIEGKLKTERLKLSENAKIASGAEVAVHLGTMAAPSSEIAGNLQTWRLNGKPKITNDAQVSIIDKTWVQRIASLFGAYN